jgi:hypothetical protein
LSARSLADGLARSELTEWLSHLRQSGPLGRRPQPEDPQDDELPPCPRASRRVRERQTVDASRPDICRLCLSFLSSLTGLILPRPSRSLSGTSSGTHSSTSLLLARPPMSTGASSERFGRTRSAVCSRIQSRSVRGRVRTSIVDALTSLLTFQVAHEESEATAGLRYSPDSADHVDSAEVAAARRRAAREHIDATIQSIEVAGEENRAMLADEGRAAKGETGSTWVAVKLVRRHHCCPTH